MEPTGTPVAPRRKFSGVVKLLAELLILVGVFAFYRHTEKQNAEYRAAIKALDDSKESVRAIEQKLQEMQQRR